ncbi:hypothetical protein [Streptomyces sp. NPDC101132]|uniref:hypothetical protein n=1 Tax=Streptomyces sp. NPDC101132 TaxID=3366110 RepID=UPI00382BFD76
MSQNRVAVATFLPSSFSFALRRCPACAVRLERADSPRHSGRPAWQSPYGPPARRTRRGRWAPRPVRAGSRARVRRGHVCGRSDV